MDTFALAKTDVYGQLPKPNQHRSYRLSEDYLSMATKDAAIQLSKAGVRLAFILNQALGSSR